MLATVTIELPTPPDRSHCVLCGREPSADFLDWAVSGEDDRVAVCPQCMATGQPALDAIEAALALCRIVARTEDDRTFEADREARVAAIATWRDKSADS